MQRWPRYRQKTPVPRKARAFSIAFSLVIATTALLHLTNSAIGAHSIAASSAASVSSLSELSLPAPSPSSPFCVRCFFNGDGVAASAAAEGDRVYVGSMGSQFLCFDVKAGKMIWQYEDRPFNYESSPALTKDRVIFGGQDKRLHCLNRANGAVKWLFNTRGQVNSSPVVCGNRVVFGSNDGKVYMVSLDAGKKVWEFETGDSVTASPAVAGGRVVIGSEDGFVYCFGPKK